jgi:hypothetical protein
MEPLDKRQNALTAIKAFLYRIWPHAIWWLITGGAGILLGWAVTLFARIPSWLALLGGGSTGVVIGVILARRNEPRAGQEPEQRGHYYWPSRVITLRIFANGHSCIAVGENTIIALDELKEVASTYRWTAIGCKPPEVSAGVTLEVGAGLDEHYAVRFIAPLAPKKEFSFDVTLRCSSMTLPKPHLEHCPKGIRTDLLILRVIFEVAFCPSQVEYYEVNPVGQTVEGPITLRVNGAGVVEKQIDKVAHPTNTYGLKWAWPQLDHSTIAEDNPVGAASQRNGSS